MKVKVAQLCLLFVTQWTVACQAPLSMRFPTQEHWSGLPFPSPGDLPDPGIEPTSSAFQAASCIAGRFFTTEPPGKSLNFLWSWPKHSFGVSSNILWKNSNKLFGQPQQKSDIEAEGA